MSSVQTNEVVAAIALILAIGGLAGVARAADGTGPGHRATTAGEAALGSNAPGRADQPRDCPRPGEPGTSPSPFYYAAASVVTAPAIGEDGSVYFATSESGLYSVDCHGAQRWKLDAPSSSIRMSIIPSPVLDRDGRVYMGFGTTMGGVLFVVAAGDGSYRTDLLAQPVAASPLIDAEQRLHIGTFTLSQANGGITVLDRSYKPLPGFPISTHRIAIAPVGLTGNRAVFASQVNNLAGGRIGGATATAIFPVSRTPDASGTPSATVTRPASSTPNAMPVASRTAIASHTPIPSASPWPLRRSAYLPLAARGEAGSGNTTEGRPPRGRGPQQATPTITGPGPFPTPPGSPFAQLYIVSDAKAPGRTFALGEGSATSLVGTGDVVIVTLAEQPPRMIALAVDSDPPVLLWQHFSRAPLPGGPALGALDPETGRLELIYADTSGLLVSLSVPGTPWATGRPTFNWARDIDAPALGSPVLGDNGELYVATRRSVLAFDRANGDQKWIFPWPRNNFNDFTGTLALAPGGMLYAGAERALVAISTGSHGLDPEARWPAPRHDARNSGMAAP